MKQGRYDVLVVGSGMGGLGAASLLANAGYRTLVVEKLSPIGGRCSTVEYKGYKLTTGAIELERGGAAGQIFKEVGIDIDSELRPSEGPLYYRVGGKDYQMPEKGAMRMLLSLVSERAEAEKIINIMRRAFTWAEPSDTISARDWLCQYTNNERILEIFNAMVRGIKIMNISELPAGAFIRYFKGRRHLHGYAPQGNLSMMESLAKVVEAKGGEVWTRCRAKRIMVADGVVRGAIVEKEGEELEISANVVISNVGPRKTIELAGNENFDKGYLKLVRETARPVSYIWVQFATDRPLFDYPSFLILTQSRRVVGMLCPTLICPEWAPPGKHLMMAGGLVASSIHPLNIKRELDLTIQDLRDNLPGFDKHAEILLASCFRGDWPLMNTPKLYELPQKTSVENLYNVGDGVAPSDEDGLSGPAATARLVAEDVKRRFQPAKA